MASRKSNRPNHVHNGNGSSNGQSRFVDHGGLDIITLNRWRAKVEQTVQNYGAYIARESVRKSSPDRRRDIDDECGYPKVIEPEWYRANYDRDPIGKRVVQVMPLESWQSAPAVYEDEDPEVKTEFELAFASLGENLKPEKSHYRTSEGNPIWEYLRRADIVSGIGYYGVLLIGIDDGKELSEPIDGMPLDGDPKDGKKNATYNAADGKNGQRHKLIYLRPYDESLATVTKYEQSKKNPRYGQPIEYQLTTVDPNLSTAGAVGAPTSTFNVHWTRVIHLADSLDTSEWFASPRQMPVFNRLMDLQKLYGGSGEMYWRGAFPGIVYSTHPQLGGDVKVSSQNLKDESEQLFNGLQRAQILKGMDAHMLSPTVVDPSAQIDKIIEAICIVLGIPKRIFMGSERGELSSGQDDRKWNDRLADRQSMYLTPRVIIPFIDRLINIGVLPIPAKGYQVVWPDLNKSTDKERADVAKVDAEILAIYADSQRASDLIQPLDFLTGIMGRSDEEAKTWLENSMEKMDSGEDGLLDGGDGQQAEQNPEDGMGTPNDGDLSGVTLDGVAENIFCPTGEGGGIDPSCGAGGLDMSKKYDRTELNRLSDGQLKELESGSMNDRTKRLAHKILKDRNEPRTSSVDATPVESDKQKRLKSALSDADAKLKSGLPEDEYQKMKSMNMLHDRTERQVRQYTDAAISWQSHDPSGAAIDYSVKEFKSAGITLVQRGGNNSWYSKSGSLVDVRIADHIGFDSHEIDLIFSADNPMTRQSVESMVKEVIDGN